jgi:hypothetical protein
MLLFRLGPGDHEAIFCEGGQAEVSYQFSAGNTGAMDTLAKAVSAVIARHWRRLARLHPW